MQESEKQTERPDIFGYADAREYVAAMVAWLRLHQQGFSLRRLVGRAGLGAPNYIQLYLKGVRSFKPATAAAVAQAMGLTEEEVRFFQALNAFTNADSEDERTEQYRTMLRLNVRQSVATIGQAQLVYFERWYVPAVHAMASLQGFQEDPEWIATRFYPPIGVDEAALAVETLLTLGFFARSESGSIRAEVPRLQTDPRIRSMWIRRYHKAMIDRSQYAVDTLPASERVTSALTVTVPHRLQDELLARVDSFRKELFAWLMEEQADEDSVAGEVYQCNFQAFPLTEEPT